MAVFAEFYKHANFGAPVETFNLDNNWRYLWVKFGSRLRNEISSLRANAYAGTAGNVYAFTERNFLGNYASLNMRPGWTSWWSYVGGARNDDIESAILVNRYASGEIVISLREQIAPEFTTQLDRRLAGTQVSRKGDPRIYTLFWPGHDSSKIFVSIEQDLNVELDWWPDYDAQVRYDIELVLTASGHIDGYVAWVYVWVEGGIFSGDIFDSLQPQLVAGAGPLTEALRAKLAIFSGFTFQDLYLLPGPPPSDAFGDLRNAKDGSTLVLVRGGIG
ncbi:MAG: hypothetical protein ACLGI6_05260 [Gammaproteobacteria bacterium]